MPTTYIEQAFEEIGKGQPLRAEAVLDECASKGEQQFLALILSTLSSSSVSQECRKGALAYFNKFSIKLLQAEEKDTILAVWELLVQIMELPLPFEKGLLGSALARVAVLLPQDKRVDPRIKLLLAGDLKQINDGLLMLSTLVSAYTQPHQFPTVVGYYQSLLACGGRLKAGLQQSLEIGMEERAKVLRVAGRWIQLLNAFTGEAAINCGVGVIFANHSELVIQLQGLLVLNLGGDLQFNNLYSQGFYLSGAINQFKATVLKVVRNLLAIATKLRVNAAQLPGLVAKHLDNWIQAGRYLCEQGGDQNILLGILSAVQEVPKLRGTLSLATARLSQLLALGWGCLRSSLSEVCLFENQPDSFYSLAEDTCDKQTFEVAKTEGAKLIESLVDFVDQFLPMLVQHCINLLPDQKEAETALMALALCSYILAKRPDLQERISAALSLHLQALTSTKLIASRLLLFCSYNVKHIPTKLLQLVLQLAAHYSADPSALGLTSLDFLSQVFDEMKSHSKAVAAIWDLLVNGLEQGDRGMLWDIIGNILKHNLHDLPPEALPKLISRLLARIQMKLGQDGSQFLSTKSANLISLAMADSLFLKTHLSEYQAVLRSAYPIVLRPQCKVREQLLGVLASLLEARGFLVDQDLWVLSGLKDTLMAQQGLVQSSFLYLNYVLEIAGAQLKQPCLQTLAQYLDSTFLPSHDPSDNYASLLLIYLAVSRCSNFPAPKHKLIPLLQHPQLAPVVCCICIRVFLAGGWSEPVNLLEQVLKAPFPKRQFERVAFVENALMLVEKGGVALLNKIVDNLGGQSTVGTQLDEVNYNYFHKALKCRQKQQDQYLIFQGWFSRVGQSIAQHLGAERITSLGRVLATKRVNSKTRKIFKIGGIRESTAEEWQEEGEEVSKATRKLAKMKK